MKKALQSLPILLVLGFVVLLAHCETGVQPSPKPGLLRITLQADPTDSLIVIARDTLKRSYRDSMQITVFQGKAYNDSNFAVLRKDTLQRFAQDHKYNILKKNPEDSTYKTFKIFEYFVPPGQYDKIQFGISAQFMQLTYGYVHGGLPVQMEKAPGANLLVDLQQEFTIESREITEINVILSPFDSATRYLDLFRFTPKVRIVNVEYPGEFHSRYFNPYEFRE